MTIMIRAAIAALTIAAAAPAQAAPVPYTINFVRTGGDNVAAPTGSFDYDAAALLGFRFSNFQVTWITLNFDLTSEANNPDVSPGGDCSADSFQNLLTGQACTNSLSGGVKWSAWAPDITSFSFEFSDLSGVKDPSSPSLTPDFQYFRIREFISGNSGTEITSFGTFTITPSNLAVPAPGTLGLLAVGLTGALFRRMRS
jgi:hypothetical protein